MNNYEQKTLKELRIIASNHHQSIQDAFNFIAFGGKARAGKSTLAQMIREIVPSQPMSFADPIRGALKAMFNFQFDANFEPDATTEQKNELLLPFATTARELMQTLGTEWGRNMVDKHIWIRVFNEDWQRWGGSTRLTVVPDLRFKEELDYIKPKKSLCIYVVKTDFDNIGPQEPKHASENSLAYSDFPHIIINDGTLEDVEKKLWVLVLTELDKVTNATD